MIQLNDAIKNNCNSWSNRFVCCHAKLWRDQPEDFNIEGATYNGWFYWTRQRNLIKNFYHRRKTWQTISNSFKRYKLPKIKGVRSITDAIFSRQRIFFLATAEDTESTYDDGEVLGSLLGESTWKQWK
jgi:hypothetical protein